MSGSTADSTNYNGTGNLGIAPSGYGAFVGSLSDIRIVKGTAVYTAAFSPPTTPLTAISGTSLLISATTSTLVDSSSNHFTVTAGTAVVQSAAPYTPPLNATSYGAAYFDGTGDTLTVPATADFTFGTNDFTIECWVNANTISDGLCVFTLVGGGFNDFILRYAGTVYWQLYYANGASTTVNLTSSNNAQNSWVHHALVRSSGTLRWYINGTQVFSTASTYSYPCTTLTLGVYSGFYWNGYISDFRIVNGTGVYTTTLHHPLRH
jgi:hypothetical protein